MTSGVRTATREIGGAPCITAFVTSSLMMTSASAFAPHRASASRAIFGAVESDGSSTTSVSSMGLSHGTDVRCRVPARQNWRFNRERQKTLYNYHGGRVSGADVLRTVRLCKHVSSRDYPEQSARNLSGEGRVSTTSDWSAFWVSIPP